MNDVRATVSEHAYLVKFTTHDHISYRTSRLTICIHMYIYTIYSIVYTILYTTYVWSN